MKIAQCVCTPKIAGLAFLILLATLPATHAQVTPVNLTTDTAADSRIPRGSVPAPARNEPRQPVKNAPLRLFVLLSAGVYTASALDMQQTQASLPDFDEHDPLARPLLRLPAPAYYATGALLATGVNWVGWKMARSSRWHKIWWLPQAASMAGNFTGYGYTRAHRASH